MIEKLGHSKRIQVMRRQWIDQGKPKTYHNGDSNKQQFQEVLANSPQGTLDVTNLLGEDRRHTEIPNDVGSEQIQSVLNNNNDKITTIKEPLSISDMNLCNVDTEIDKDKGNRRESSDDLDALLAEEDAGR